MSFRERWDTQEWPVWQPNSQTTPDAHCGACGSLIPTGPFFSYLDFVYCSLPCASKAAQILDDVRAAHA